MKQHIPTEVCDKCILNKDPIEDLIRKIVKGVLEDLGVLDALDELGRVVTELRKLEEKYNNHTHITNNPKTQEPLKNVKFCMGKNKTRSYS